MATRSRSKSPTLTASSSTAKKTSASVVDRKKAEADVLFLSIGEGAIVTDINGEVNRVNQAALDILGMKKEDLVGKWYPGTVIAENEKGKKIPYLERPIAEVFLSGRTVFRKLFYRKLDGSRIAVALTVSPVLLDEKPIGAIEIFRDITEELRLEKAKDEFISLASHQLRTPATGVKQYLGMLEEGYAGDLTKEQKIFLQTALESNDRQLRIIDDLLKVAAADTGNLVLKNQKINLVPLVRAVIAEQSSNFASKNQTVELYAESETMCAKVDEAYFRMVLDNLIDNAHKYTYPGKRIDVAIRQKSSFVTISVKDQGTGISKNDFNKLFQKFSRLDNPLSVPSGGTGLGLYLVKQVIDLHGGSIRVASKPEKGSTFTISVRGASNDSL